MKLKKAKKIAKNIGYKAIAVDMDCGIYAYKHSGIIAFDCRWSGHPAMRQNHDKFIGNYTGSKHWTETMREVK